MSTEYRQQGLFRLRSAGLLIGGVFVVLLILGRISAAIGIVLGLALYAVNLFLMLEIGRSLLRRSDEHRPKAMAALSSVGRLFFIAIVLSMIAIFVGRDAVLGACGGLLIAQVNLHVPTTRH